MHFYFCTPALKKKSYFFLLWSNTYEIKFTILTFEVYEAGALSMFTVLCKRYLYFQDVFVTPKGDPVPMSGHCCAPPAPENTNHFLCVRGRARSGLVTYTASHAELLSLPLSLSSVCVVMSV